MTTNLLLLHPFVLWTACFDISVLPLVCFVFSRRASSFIDRHIWLLPIALFLPLTVIVLGAGTWIASNLCWCS